MTFLKRPRLILTFVSVALMMRSASSTTRKMTLHVSMNSEAVMDRIVFLMMRVGTVVMAIHRSLIMPIRRKRR